MTRTVTNKPDTATVTDYPERRMTCKFCSLQHSTISEAHTCAANTADRYKALCEELREAFGPLMEVLASEGWEMRRSEIAKKYLAAQAALIKAKD